ncbi:hypothetical protein ACFO3D_13805 [Virgibacillus kekensis]|uniref:Uncharacterized protein n=1 Tax=Virgibacillus kekensis TaxID=202261 RepID=A0ABV9DLQ3_9BACI
MKYPLLLLLIGTYLVAFVVNFMPAIKHPDSHATTLNMLMTAVFLIVLLLSMRKKNKLLSLFLIGGAVSGIIVFVIKTFESHLIGNGILDIVASIQYPFYLIFTTPLFGANIMFNLNYATFSLLMSLVYLILFIWTHTKQTLVMS